jgi:hypothetical protein
MEIREIEKKQIKQNEDFLNKYSIDYYVNAPYRKDLQYREYSILVSEDNAKKIISICLQIIDEQKSTKGKSDMLSNNQFNFFLNNLNLNQIYTESKKS